MQNQPGDMSGRAWVYLTDLFIAPGGRIGEATLPEGGQQAMQELEEFGFVRRVHFGINQRGKSHSLHEYYMLTDEARQKFENMSAF